MIFIGKLAFSDASRTWHFPLGTLKCGVGLVVVGGSRTKVTTDEEGEKEKTILSRQMTLL